MSSETKTIQNDVVEIIKVAQQAIEPMTFDIHEPGGTLVVPVLQSPAPGGGVTIQGLKKYVDEWRPFPERRKGVSHLGTLQSFIELTKRHASTDSALFAGLDGDKPSLVAIIDYHTMAGEARNLAHRMTYKFPISPELAAWRLMDGKPMSQLDWAQFIENHIAELVTPHAEERAEFEEMFLTRIATPAELITLSRGLAVTVESKVRDFRTLQSGEVEVSFEEVHRDGRGEKLVVPGLFIIRVPLFSFGGPHRLLVRLRYKKAGTGIAWHYQIYRIDDELREAMRADAATAAKEAGLPLYEGSPEA